MASRDLGDCRTMSAAACGKAQELSQKILDKGLPSVEDIRDKLAACQDDTCKTAMWAEYRQASEATVENLKQMALNGELSREELAFIVHDLGKELAVAGYQEGDKLGRAENLSWINGGNGPLPGFFNAELRQKELEIAGYSKADAALKVENEQFNLLLLQTAAGFIAANAGGIKNTYNSIKNAPLYPQGFRAVQNGTTKNTVNNKEALDSLRAIEPGKWSKVYKDGYDASGNKVSVHYFQSQSGKVFDVKVKPNWSNQK